MSECVCECPCGALRGPASEDLSRALRGLKNCILSLLEDVVPPWATEIILLSGSPARPYILILCHVFRVKGH